ncbi:hypothetical protein MVES1_000917 [Malassezia vespertilionis]|uniref:Dihydroorotate dehydrogenase (quinone), mitochondrial n=1 Tax=Malassezia vespertilionis TaxID=2020962 RepID=A0A2N1JE32_9BASI|nr:uncharacterized protein MVES1_000917 [Malassezia vespertilionis]PKI84805.1 Ura9p [Malassezia vespertilionis]WFD05587.1 hypothetical protein MVES1_000917 [Malassezia vespertilionis]
MRCVLSALRVPARRLMPVNGIARVVPICRAIHTDVPKVVAPAAELPRKLRRAPRKLFSALSIFIALTGGLFFGVYCLDSRAGVYRWLFMPVIHTLMSPETASKFAITMLRLGIAPRDKCVDDEVLHTELFGKPLTNPLGLAAGFDKQAEAIDGCFDLGFALVEVGSVTPQPQPGNPAPRMFRLPLDQALINRMGFNSDGHAAVQGRLHDRVRDYIVRVIAAGKALVSDVGVESLEKDATQLRRAQFFAAYADADVALLDRLGIPRSLKQDRLLGINLGKNKTSREDSSADFVQGVWNLGPYADMLIVNVSSPNTPGLRRLQRRSVLRGLLDDVVRARGELLKLSGEGRSLPLLVKVSSDLSDSELEDVSDAAENANIDGIIVSNTTVSRPPGLLSEADVQETGGLSGPPLKSLALHALQVVYARSHGKIPLIGCGGISSGEDALDFARAGASAVQLYTSLGYEGAGVPRRIKDQVTDALHAEGTTWKQLVGTGLKHAPQEYAPDPRKAMPLYPGSQDALQRSIVGVRNELDQWRASFSAHDTEMRRALPFHVHPNDAQYIDLLDRAHRAIDGTPHFEHGGGVRAASIPEHLLVAASSEHKTQGQVLHDALRQATLDPQPRVDGLSTLSETPGGVRAPKEARPAATFRVADQQRVV